MAHSCNPTTQEAEVGGLASLGNILSPDTLSQKAKRKGEGEGFLEEFVPEGLLNVS